ncbi:RluA family pseudouridine synthase [Candidatus Pelagibacter sp.]|nr:RluA family pseudouridine synthase [Candidatus Pelagibacter sp.]
MKNIINFIIKEDDNNKRVDTILANHGKSLSRTRVKNLILDSKLKINEKIIQDPSIKTKLNDKIELEIVEPKKQSLKPYNFKLNIIHEDEDLIVIDKPSGISMHPGPGNYDNTIVNALINYNSKNLSNISGELRPGIVHRIDKDTSGLIVVAKNNLTHEKLSVQFSEHSITRVYQTLVWGKFRPQKGKIETFITRSSKNRQMMEVSSSKGKKAITYYETLELFESDKVPTFSFIQCKLETGRTHQIRVHMSYQGNNILGDKKYKKKFKKFKNIDEDLNDKILNLDRQFLHARQLGFDHPKTGERLEFSSNIPNKLNDILKKLRKLSK